MDFYTHTYEHLIVNKLPNHILKLTLDNPSQSNAITLPMIDSLTKVLKYADFDPEVRVIILTGMGKSFCAGGDIKAMKEKSGMFHGESNELRLRYMHGIQQIPRAMEELSTPVIAMINGPAIGAGLDLACMCDLRLASSEAKFGETFVKLGLVPGDGGTFFLQRIIGYAKAMELTLTGEVIDAHKALSLGLINQVVSVDDLEAATMKMAELISANAPVSVGMAKKAMKISYLHDLATSLDLLASFQGITQRTHDHFEALKAFEEKRKPLFHHT